METKAEFETKTTEVTLRHIQLQPLVDCLQLSCVKSHLAKDPTEIKEYIKLIELFLKDLRSLTGIKEISQERLSELLGTDAMGARTDQSNKRNVS